MDDLHDILDRGQQLHRPHPGAFDRLERRRRRKQRTRRLSGAAVALLVSGAAAWMLIPLGGLEHRSAAPVIDGATATRLGVAWTTGIGDSPTAPVVAGDLAFVGTGSGVLYAIDVGSGRVVWVGRLRGSIVAPPAIHGDEVVVHTTSGTLAAFDAGCGTRGATCTPAWTADTGDDVGAPPSVLDGVVYVNAGDDRLVAFEGCSSGRCEPAWVGRVPAGGAPRWPAAPAAVDGWVWTVLGGDPVVFPARCDEVCRPAQRQFAGVMSVGPIVGDELVVLGSNSGYLYGFRTDCADRCRAVWRARADAPTAPAVAGGTVFVSGAPGGGLAAVPEDCRMSGAPCPPSWVGDIDGSPTSPVVVSNGVVYIGSSDGHLHAFPAICDETCSASTVVKVGSSIGGIGVWGGRAILVTSIDGTMRAITVGGVAPTTTST
ncbi:MAG: PQQ-binding-like beta-propeller repeat protein [Actinomycetota bacterium]